MSTFTVHNALGREGLNAVGIKVVWPGSRPKENLDGKYLLRTVGPKLAVEDIALGYKQLLEVGRGWCGLKQVTDLRPGYHRKEERIRAHIIFGWPALLLIQIAETATGLSWAKITDEPGLPPLPPSPSRPAPSASPPSSPRPKLKVTPPKTITEAIPAAP